MSSARMRGPGIPERSSAALRIQSTLEYWVARSSPAMTPEYRSESSAERWQYRGFQRRAAADQVGSLVGDHQGRGVEIGGDHARHDRGIDHAQVLQAVHAQLIIDNSP